MALQVLFNWETPQSIPEEILDTAMKAAINFVGVSIQHAAYLAGRKDLQEEIGSLQQVQLGIVMLYIVDLYSTCMFQCDFCDTVW